jgi:hypothetical protein
MKLFLYKKQLLLILILSGIGLSQVMATHLIGGEISHEYIGNHNYVVEIKLYRDCSGIPMQNNYATLNVRRTNNHTNHFSVDLPLIGSSDITGVCSIEPTICTANTNAVYGIEEYLYKDTVNVWFDTTSNMEVLFEWNTCCYPNSITTIIPDDLMVFSIAYYSPNLYSNKTPFFNLKPLNYACIGNLVNYGNGAIDLENDSLIYSLIDCFEDTDYINGNSIYDYVSYNTGFSGTQPFTTQSPITIDSETGMISFTPTVAEIGPMCVMVEEYRNGIKISEKVRSVLLNIQNCSNANPNVSGFNGTASATGVTGATTMTNLNIGQQICFDIQGYDDIGQNVTLNHSNNLTGATYTGSNFGNNPTLNVCWTPTIDDVGISIFSVIAEDDNCPTLGKSIQTYKFSVNAPYTIQGRVFQPDGSLLSDAEVQLYDTTGTLIGIENTTNGFYRFVMNINNSPNQSYYVSAIPNSSFNGLDKTYHGDVPVPQYSTTIPVYNNRTNIANINALEAVTITGNGQISGLIKSVATGNIVPDTRIVLVDNNGNYLKDVIADQSGFVQFTDLANVTYPIWVDDFNIDNDIAPPVDIALAPIHDNIEFLLHDSYLELSYPTNTALKLARQIQLIPNPTNGLLSIQLPYTNEVEVAIYSLDGQLLQQQRTNKTDHILLDISDLPNQIYLIRLMTDEGVVTKRIMKQ